MLRYPDYNKQFIVTVDASKTGCGAVLSQRYGDIDLPIYFAFKKFTKGESNTSTPVQELYAIHFAITQFRPYIYGTSFLVKSDHKPLIYIFSCKNLSPKLQRIRVEIEDYTFDVEHIKGKDNVVADALSRISIEDLKRFSETSVENNNNDSVSILNITTRSMAKRQNSNHSQPDRPKSPSRCDNVNILHQSHTQLDKTVPRIRCFDLLSGNGKQKLELRAYKNFKSILNIDISSMFVNEKLSLETILSTLQHEAHKLRINKIQWPTDDKVFSYITINEFKSIGTKILTSLTIILVHSQDDQEQKRKN